MVIFGDEIHLQTERPSLGLCKNPSPSPLLLPLPQIHKLPPLSVSFFFLDLNLSLRASWFGGKVSVTPLNLYLEVLTLSVSELSNYLIYSQAQVSRT